jgi:flagellar basal body-associated protein FliL
MRWLMVALLVSVAALLLAAAGVACHIWIQCSKHRNKPVTGNLPQAAPGQTFDPADEFEP